MERPPEVYRPFGSRKRKKRRRRAQVPAQQQAQAEPPRCLICTGTVTELMNMGRRVFGQGICLCIDDVSIRCDVCLIRMAKDSPDQCTVCHRPWNPNAIQFVHINRKMNWNEFAMEYSDTFDDITIVIIGLILLIPAILYIPRGFILLYDHAVYRLNRQDVPPLGLLSEFIGKLGLLFLSFVWLVVILYFLILHVGQYLSLAIMTLVYLAYLPFANNSIRELVDVIILEEANNPALP